MAYIQYDSKQHKQGKKIENFMFNFLKSKNKKVYRPIGNSMPFKLPLEIKKYIKERNLLFFETYPFDIFLIEGNKLKIIEIKSKSVKFTKDDRKLDISLYQYDIFKHCESSGIKIKIFVVWIHKNKFYYKFYNFSDLKVIGKKKLKLKLPNDTIYSPNKVSYIPLKY